MGTTEDCKQIFMSHGGYTYKIVAGVALIPTSEPEPHAGEWEAKITIYKTTNVDPPRTQSFHSDPQYGATEDDARKRSFDYGRKLVLGAIEGLNI